MLNNGYNKLWPTTVLLDKITNDNLLNNVIQTILQEVNLDVPVSDFQDFDILQDGPNTLQEFRDAVVIPAFKNYLKHHNIDLNEFPNFKLRSWIAGAKDGYMIPLHNHSGAAFSAVFYLMCDDVGKGGELMLVDPRTNANRGYNIEEYKKEFSQQTYMPSSGEFVIFPGFLYHYTLPFTGSLRLAMPVDLFL
jgi:hypothetical protein